MLTKVLGALAGRKVAGRNYKLSGALIGAAVPVIAKRGLGAIGVAVAAGWGAKKLIDYSRRKRSGEARRRNRGAAN